MHKRVRQQVVWIWVAMLGLLFSVLAPAVSHAMTSSASAQVQVCTMEGMKTIVVEGEQAATADHFFKHCPYCALQGGAGLPPPSSSPGFAPLLADGTHPPLFYQAARPLFQWSTANPRAPPSSN